MAWNAGNAGYKIDPGNKLISGTCVLSELDAYGTINSCSIERTGNGREVLDCIAAARAYLIENPGYEMTFECLMDADVEAPDLLTEIEFPYVGIFGSVIPGSQVKWEQGGERKLSVKCKAWASLEVEGDQANVYHWNGSWATPA